MSREVSPARIAAYEVLRRVEEDAAYLSILLSNLPTDLRVEDRALCHEISLGSVRWQLWLDKVIQKFSGRFAESLDRCVRIALRIGLYQIRFLSKIPHSAAVNESVNLVHGQRFGAASGFVNAVLRRACREIKYDPAAEIADPIERLSVKYSHPDRLVRRWIEKFGIAETEKFIKANNENAPVSFRICPDFDAATDISREEQIFDELRQAGVDVVPSCLVSGAWRLKVGKVGKGGATLNNLANKGLVYIQDEASQLAAALVAPVEGDRIIDVCAAPGSKATQIAANTPRETLPQGTLPQGTLIVAGDRSEARLRTMKKSMELQKIKWIQIVCYDAERELPFAQSTFDKVLVDARCSGTGTLRRNPEIRWRINLSDIKELSAHQKRVISNAAQLVAPDGQLLYSTCSVEREEAEE
ncbi:MAG: transcription antitermination factor NusB, partial [Pyrinomonadaceae bacterium]